MTLAAMLVGATPLMLVGASFALPIIYRAIRSKALIDAYAIAWGSEAAIAAIYAMIKVLSEGKPILYEFGGWPPPLGVVYEVDCVSALLGVVTAIVILVALVYSVWYSAEFGARATWYYALSLLLEAGLLGCLYTGDAFNLFVMMELAAIACYALVAFHRDRVASLEASIKYGLIGAAATSIYFLAVMILYLSFGTLNMADLALRAREMHTLLGTSMSLATGIEGLALSSSIALFLSLWTFMYVSAIFPNHFWLPDAHPEAPTPISAVLSGVVVNIGAYAALRFFYTIFGPLSIAGVAHPLSAPFTLRDLALYISMMLGAVTSLLGATLMIVQRDVKRLLAYSTISHMGLVFMAISLGLSNVPLQARVLALAAALYHIVNHSIGKSLLFLSSGVYISLTGSRNIDRWCGAPANTTAFAGMVVGALNLLGVPPLGGFFSKLMLVQAFISCGMWWLVLVLIASSAISLPAYVKLLSVASPRGSARKLSYFASVPIAVLMVLCIAMGVLYVASYAIPIFERISSCIASPAGIESYIEVAKRSASILSLIH